MRVTKYASLLFHPFLIPLLGVIILLHTTSWMTSLNDQAKSYLYLVTISLTVLLPVSILFVFHKQRWIKSITIKEAKEWRFLLMLQSLFILIAAFILQKVSAPLVLALFFNGVSMAFLFTAILSNRWNFSLHLIGMGCVFGLLMAIGLKWMLDIRIHVAVLLIIASMLASLRLREINTPLQVYLGFLIGAGFVFASVYLI